MQTKTVNSEVKKFMSQIQQCSTVQQEQEIVQKELALIRKEFTNPRINGYNRMINAYKLVVISTLGYEIDSGMVEIITLLADPKFAHKQAGYLAFLTSYINVPEACSLLINTMQNDLQNTKDEVICEVMHTLGIITNPQISEVMAPTIMKFAFGFSEPIVRKKAFIVLKQMFKFFPNLVDLEPDLMKKIESLLQKEYDQGVLYALCLFLYEMILKDKKEGENLSKYKSYGVYLVQAMKALLTDPQIENSYSGICMPWFIILLIKIIPLIPLEQRELNSFHSLCEEFLQIGFSNSLLTQ